jgi:hypothetical protein
MEDAERFRLLGKYRTHRFRVGQRVRCLVRGEMVITGCIDELIPWLVEENEPFPVATFDRRAFCSFPT